VRFLLDTSDTLAKCQEDLGPSIEIGQLVTPLTGRTNLGVVWAMDNGAFARFDSRNFLRILKRDEEHKSRCLFVALPDVVGAARRTLELFDAWEERVGFWPKALVMQDGIEDLDLGAYWHRLRAVFIGGTTAFKNSPDAMHVALAARALDIHVHVGRVNTPERMDRWLDVADSADGTGVARYTHMRKALTEDHLFKATA
jgi:hypothetical protein